MPRRAPAWIVETIRRGAARWTRSDPIDTEAQARDLHRGEDLVGHLGLA